MRAAGWLRAFLCVSFCRICRSNASVAPWRGREVPSCKSPASIDRDQRVPRQRHGLPAARRFAGCSVEAWKGNVVRLYPPRRRLEVGEIVHVAAALGLEGQDARAHAGPGLLTGGVEDGRSWRLAETPSASTKGSSDPSRRKRLARIG